MVAHAQPNGMALLRFPGEASAGAAGETGAGNIDCQHIFSVEIHLSEEST